MESVLLWKDAEKQTIDPSLFSSVAESFAQKMAKDSESSRGRENKRTQIRKFYDEVLRLNMIAKTRADQWEQILPLVHMLTAKAAYAKGRNLISHGFMAFIKSCVQQVHTPRDLDLFSNFFEAFMGFYRLYGPRN